jgi:hypothetical protein
VSKSEIRFASGLERKRQIMLRKMNLQLFAEGDTPPAEETPQETNLDTLLGTMNTPPAATPPATPPATETPPAEAPAATAETTPPAAPTEEQTPEQVFTADKQNQAFAAMRTQNTQYTRIINKMAEVLGVQDTSNPEAVLTALSDRLLAYEAQQTNVPVELLKRVQDMEIATAQQEAKNREEQANLGFQKVKDTFKLDDKGLVEFAKQLNSAGKDPYQTPMDLLQEYRSLNYDNILKKAQEDAVREALAKRTQSAAHSSTPSSAQGKPSTPAAPINDIQGLDALLAGFGSS